MFCPCRFCIMRRDEEERSSPATNDYTKPAWAKHSTMPTLPTCTQDVSQDTGVSDYGRLSHTCASCGKACTETNKQQPINMTWLFEPSLSSCNVHDVTVYINWSHIHNLHCGACDDIGLRHKVEMSIAANAGDAVPAPSPAEKPVLAFETWMGPEVYGTSALSNGAGFSGKHVFEVMDTVEPSKSDNCNAVAPHGRWIAMPANYQAGDSFTCTRVAQMGSYTFPCQRTFGLRCEANMAMGSHQVFKYRMYRDTADGVVTTISYQETATSPAETRSGVEWVVVAEDITHSVSPMVVGRIILEGVTSNYGIKEMKQAHHHIGCVECDRFYASTIVTGPFIAQPAGSHALRSANGIPPAVTTESCGLWRMTSIEGNAVMFETGPGLWPTDSMSKTLYTCSGSASSTCPV